MSYEVFTLKYRPRTFVDVVGQRAVADTLKRAIQTDRVANAYLFCGSRGVGKTSMARIVSKALNCPNAADGEPCNRCEICVAVGRGEDIDVIEIDGASNRGIDDVRGIRDAAGYVPSRSRCKIYIIDEVHMLTIQAFNALLKVLEEPPPHVKFIFATTDPGSLPETILSRCQRHEFKRISENDIVERLSDICSREGVEASGEALEAMARKAEGGLRDSVSLLDQVISYAGTRIELSDLEAAIGMLPREHRDALLVAIAAGAAADVLRALNEAFWSGYDPQELLGEMTSVLRELMVWHTDPEGYADRRHAELFDSLAGAMSLDRVMYVLRLFLNVRGEIRRSGHEQVQLELTCLKAARSRELLPVAEIIGRLEGHVPESAAAPAAPAVPAPASDSRPPPGARHVAAPVPPAAAPAQAKAPAAPPAAPSAPPQPAAEPPATLDLSVIRDGWESVRRAVAQESGALGSVLAGVTPSRLDGTRLVLAVPAGKRFVVDQLAETRARSLIAAALKSSFGADLGLAVVEEAAAEGGAAKQKKSVYDDPSVRKFVEHFDGGVSNVEMDDG